MLFVQATDAAAYPPLINAAVLCAEQGWHVDIVNAPMADKQLQLPDHPSIRVHALEDRPTHVMEKRYYARYTGFVARLAWQLRPDVVYASDPLGAGPGMLAARSAGARLSYHEHDSPLPGTGNPVVAQLRKRAMNNADLVVFPNAERGRLAQAQLGVAECKLRIVWNLPRRAELPRLSTTTRHDPLVLYYHGSITPDRLPMTMVEAVARFDGAVRLQVVGYEVASGQGWMERLFRSAAAPNGRQLIEFVGAQSREGLLETASQAHVGLALMPNSTQDVNMRHMTGASNKIFDYMAAGLVGIVSDLPDWTEMFVAPGHARSCDPDNVDSIASVIRWCLEHPREIGAMAERSRAKIEAEWNYDEAFAPVLSDMAGGRR